jgi:hypothetical protein
MSKTGVFVDDQETVYAKLLTRRGELEFQYLAVDTDIATLANRIRDYDPAVVALDYRLDQEVGGLAPEKTYKASAVAQHLRDKAVERPGKDFAIVLVSAEEKIRTLFDPDRTAHDLFDRVYVKEQITEDPDTAQAQLVALADAYGALVAQQGYDLEGILGTEADDRVFVDIQELKSAVESASAPHQVIGFLLKHVFDKPGLLLDAEDTAARLGITPASLDKIAAKLDQANLTYKGLLANAWPRWWAHRLEGWLTETFGARPITLPAVTRAQMLSAMLDTQLDPAKSPWTDRVDEKIAVACASCRRGTEVRHSVSAFEGSMPRYRIARRICWDCVQTDRYESAHPPLQIDDVDRPLAQKVKAMEKPAGE